MYIYVWKVSRNFADCIGRAMHNPMETMTGKTYGDKKRKAGRKLSRLSDRAILSQDFPTTFLRIVNTKFDVNDKRYEEEEDEKEREREKKNSYFDSNESVLYVNFLNSSES